MPITLTLTHQKTNTSLSTCILDRDGTLFADTGYCCDLDLVILNRPLLRTLIASSASYRFIVCTNQSGIARGYFSEADHDEFAFKLLDFLHILGLKIEQYIYCPHQDGDECECRKPKPGMLDTCFTDSIGTLVNTVMFGDSIRDKISYSNSKWTCKTFRSVFLPSCEAPHIDQLLGKQESYSGMIEYNFDIFSAL